MEKSKFVNRNQLKIAQVPRSYLIIGCLVISISLGVYLCTGFFLKYSDEYKARFIFNSTILKEKSFLLKDIPLSFLKNVSNSNTVKVYVLENKKSYSYSLNVNRIDIQVGQMEIDLTEKDKIWINQFLLQSPLLNSEIVIKDKERNLFTRLIESKKQIN